MKRSFLLLAGFLLLAVGAYVAWELNRQRVPDFLQSGHALDSTEVVDWEPLSDTKLEVSLRFRDNAPWWGCSVEALSDGPSLDVEDRSIGVLTAKPMKKDARVMTMHLDNGTADDVDKVQVTDCDV